MTYDTRTDNILANKYARESIDAVIDVLQADSQFSTHDRNAYGLGAGVGASGYLPDFQVSEGGWQGYGEEGFASAKCRALEEYAGAEHESDHEDESDPEGGKIRQAKKEKASAQESQEDDSDEEGGNIRQAKKEKASAQENQHFESDPVSGKIRQMKKEKASD